MAAKFRHHKFYRNKYGADNFIVSNFELQCHRCGISLQTIYQWGELIEEWTTQENAANLVLACDGMGDAAQESAALKNQVILLKEQVSSRDRDLLDMKQQQHQILEQQQRTNNLLNQLVSIFLFVCCVNRHSLF